VALVLKRNYPGYRNLYYLPSPSEPKGGVRWSEVIRKIPFLLHHLVEKREHAESFRQFALTRKGAKELAALFSREPEILVSSFNVWALLLQLDELAGSVREIMCSNVDRLPIRGHYRVEDNVFPVKLPSDADLLPYILEAVLQPRSHERHLLATAEPIYHGANIRERVKAVFPEANHLKAVIESAAYSKRTRAAASCLYILHQRAEMVGETIQQLPNLYETEIGGWFLRAAGIVLTDWIAAEKPEGLKAMNRILDAERDNFEARLALDPILRTWREDSARAGPSKYSALWSVSMTILGRGAGGGSQTKIFGRSDDQTATATRRGAARPDSSVALGPSVVAPHKQTDLC
jgi:hypothetical protein